MELLVERSLKGDKASLEQLLHGIKDMIYNLSLKMLLFPEDAEDATQEILIRIVTRLSTFKGSSQFKTWVYRVATNYLLSIKGKQSRKFAMNFEDYADFIDSGQSNRVVVSKNEAELQMLEEEVKISCTQGLLLCLDAKHRAAYILGDIMEADSREGAEILSVTAENFRQLLTRSRKKVRNFLQGKCGLVNSDNPCRCVKKIDFLLSKKLIDSGKLKFAQVNQRSIDLINAIDSLQKEMILYQTNPSLKSPQSVGESIKRIMNNVTL